MRELACSARNPYSDYGPVKLALRPGARRLKGAGIGAAHIELRGMVRIVFRLALYSYKKPVLQLLQVEGMGVSACLRQQNRAQPTSMLHDNRERRVSSFLGAKCSGCRRHLQGSSLQTHRAPNKCTLTLLKGGNKLSSGSGRSCVESKSCSYSSSPRFDQHVARRQMSSALGLETAAASAAHDQQQAHGNIQHEERLLLHVRELETKLLSSAKVTSARQDSFRALDFLERSEMVVHDRSKKMNRHIWE